MIVKAPDIVDITTVIRSLTPLAADFSWFL